ncbi:MAG: hypothetical protein M1827_001121 [Pycnora praestabilis]|nr:MAG: hypothetical protein M1827_001121 [Pycnora praestabilis]
MTTREMGFIAPLANSLPPLPEGEVFSHSQWTTLLAIADTVIPSVQPSSLPALTSHLSISSSEYEGVVTVLKAAIPQSHDANICDRYLEECPSSIPAFRASLQRTFSDFVREDARKGIALILTILDTRAGSLITTGYAKPFYQQPIDVRQAILRGWATSYLPPLRQSYRALTSLFKNVWLKSSPTVGPVLGFPRVPVHGKPGKGFDYKFLQFVSGTEPAIVETDVVIVGSGCGGGVCAKNLAEDGHSVLVADKAYYHPPEHLPMSENDAGIHMFMNGGVESSDDNSISVIAGQAWGGGGTINWSASLQTQGYVRREWAEKGLSFFTSSEYQTCLDRVCHRMGVSTDYVRHNAANRALLEGARKLGYSAKTVPQNTGGNEHYCGYCTLGCGAAQKQGPVVSWLPDAQKAGAQFMEGFDAEKIIFEERNNNKIAVGVKGIWTSRDKEGGFSGNNRIKREVLLRAKKIIVSAGTLQSPLLLLRSGLKNHQIGRNLHLHPVSFLGATYKEETRPWEGAILTSVCDELQNLDGRGHGVKLETTCMLPSWFLTFVPWSGGLDFKLFCSQFKHYTGFISLARERDPGRVYPDPVDGRCRIEYSPSAYDRQHILEGVIALAKINLVTGAETMITGTEGVSQFVRSEVASGQEDLGINDPRFQAWIAEIRKKGLHAPDATFASAHQMGTCRMGVNEKTSVVDFKGKVWGTEGLYVSDASIFPSASGVNPMITNMAISDWISRGLGKELRNEIHVGEMARL